MGRDLVAELFVGEGFPGLGIARSNPIRSNRSRGGAPSFLPAARRSAISWPMNRVQRLRKPGAGEVLRGRPAQRQQQIEKMRPAPAGRRIPS